MLAGLVWLHRWGGVTLSLLFALWFATGAVMVFVPYPSLSPQEAWAHAAPIDLGRVRLSPNDLKLAPAETPLRLVSLRGSPAYVVQTAGPAKALSAETGEGLPSLTAAEAGAVAGRFAGAPVARVDGPMAYDQWMVHQQFDPLRPLYRVRMADPAATEFYVSAATGEVVQKTAGVERALNWVGSVIHWIYFTPIRKVFSRWDWTVWIVSLAGVGITLLGLWLGIDRTARRLVAARKGLSPFKGWMLWHHLIGLGAGLFVLTWIVSGWLSMDHGRLFSRGEPAVATLEAYGGANAWPVRAQDLRRLGRPTVVEFGRVAGRQVAAAHGPQGARVAVGGAITRNIPQALVDQAVRAAWPEAAMATAEPVAAESFLAKAEGLSSGTTLRRLRHPDLRVYVDGVSGQLLTVMDHSREAYAWAYYALHTWNLPGLADRPALRIGLLLVPLLAGFLFSLTSVVIGVRRLSGAFGRR